MRADLFLCLTGQAKSRTQAQEMIKLGTVFCGEAAVTKPSWPVPEGETLTVTGYEKKYVSRAGLKLEAALDRFGINAEGRTALDIGASTGGFTDCLLSRGAARVYAVDVGHGQLDGKLASDPRVVSMEGVNARELSSSIKIIAADIVTMDVSFISQTHIIPEIVPFCSGNTVFVSLIKPQFESGKENVGRGGIVRDPVAHRNAVERVLECAVREGFFPMGAMKSPIPGGDGNTEFLAAFSFGRQGTPDMDGIYREVGL